MRASYWFLPAQLEQLSRPTLDVVAEWIQTRNDDAAIETCKQLKQEWGFLRRLMVDSALAIVTYIRETYGASHGQSAIRYLTEKVWLPAFDDIEDPTRQKVAADIVARWKRQGVSLDQGTSWFSPSVLNSITYPVVEANIIQHIKEAKYEEAISCCEEAKHEWGLIHDLLVETIVALLTFIGERFGEAEVGRCLEKMTEQVWKDPFLKIHQRSRKDVAIALAATWRAHSTSGVGPEAGGFSVQEDDEKLTFILNPCGSGQRLWRRRFYEPPKSYGMTKEAYPWSFQRKDFPYYCAHCTYMNEILPIEWSGAPLYPLDPPETPDQPCIWYFYKHPQDTPQRFYERYGYDKQKMLNRHSQKPCD